jgi:hypothetical protein
MMVKDLEKYLFGDREAPTVVVEQPAVQQI